MNLLNTLSPNRGSKQNRKRVGRGIGSGMGKTCGKGHKGQKARSGGYHKINFEGGQMPIQRRMPKMGFKSRSKGLFKEITLSEIAKLQKDEVTIETLKDANLINKCVRVVKVIRTGKINNPVKLKNLQVTKGAKLAILECGGIIE